VAEKNPITLIDERSLKTVFRGYEREATDDLLEELGRALVAIMVERDAALARVEQLENGLDALRRLEGQITDVLAVAARIRGESESRAEELIRGAEAEKERILGQARSRARVAHLDARDAQEVSAQTRERLTRFLELSLREVERADTDLDSVVRDLVKRAPTPEA
jgi:cell division initiation protein